MFESRVPGVPGVPNVLRVPTVHRPTSRHSRHIEHVRHFRHSRHFGSARAALVVFAVIAASEALALAQATPGHRAFMAAQPAEVIATVTVRCDACAWDVVGREAVVLTIALDGRYVQHLPVVRGGRADYRVSLGPVEPGSHAVRVDLDSDLTSKDLRGVSTTVETIAVEQIAEGSPNYRAVALAPIVYARPNTVGRFTDVPVFMWYEVEPTDRGTRYRYSVIFTNEDGGTPADRLMATWGRTTDIEYLYSVEVDRGGVILAEDIQGPEHEILAFRGRREGRHPLLWVATDNNMVMDEGTTRVRYAPASREFPLTNVSREAVMDANPWLYAVMAAELVREKKIVPGGPPGKGSIPDPRRFVYLEACGEVGDSALAFSIRAGDQWIASDRGLAEYRITRDGCFRAAMPLPEGLTPKDIRSLRAQAFERANKQGGAPARLTRLNKLFTLDERYTPSPSLLTWQGSTELQAGGSPLEIPIR